LISTFVLAVSASLFLWRNLRQTVELRETAVGVRQLGRLSEQPFAEIWRGDAYRRFRHGLRRCRRNYQC